MAKQLLKERFQELAGIKPLYENEASQTLIVTSESGARVEITDPEDIKAFLAGEEVYGEGSQGEDIEVSLDDAQDHEITEEAFGGDNLGEAKDKYGRSIKSLSEEEASAPFALDSRTIENLKHLTNFRGDEKIEELTGLANYILDTPSPSFEKK